MLEKRLRSLRKGRKMSQQALADAIGVVQSTIFSYERGTRKPSYEVLCSIADFFNVTTDYLLGRTDIPNMYAQGVLSVNGEEWDIYSENKNLSPDEREQVERQIHGAMTDDQRFILQDSSPESLEEFVRRIAEQVYQERDKQNENDS